LGDNLTDDWIKQSGPFNTNKPFKVKLRDEALIKKISCGPSFCLFLSNEGDIYWFGLTGCDGHLIPTKLSINSLILRRIAKIHFL
jgi:alpha-tubulin suppressor-like RCC1 family protein